MKKIFAIVLALALLCSVAFAETKTLVMGTNATFPPYEYVENDEIIGIDAEIAQAICDYLGYELVIEDMDFNFIISYVQEGKIDFGMAGMTVNEERLQKVDFTTPYAKGIQVVIVKEDSPITSIDDLFDGDYLVGVQTATTGDIYATGDFGVDRVMAYDNGPTAVANLLNGKVDCVIIDNEPAKVFVEKNEGIKLLDSAYAEEDYAACISKDNPELLAEFNAAFEALTNDGTIPAIIAKYIPAE